MQNKELADILESKITGNTVRIGRTLAEEIVKALKGKSESVNHGHWKYPLGMAWNYVCSECGANGGVEGTPYCPNCGARMDGEV